MNKNVIRLLDVLLSISGLLLTFPILLLIFIIGFIDTGSPIFRQQRVGRLKKPFTLIKFRTMKRNTKHVASHLAHSSSITCFGSFLRKSKLDELPQLWNVLTGEMSLVGPRPCLFSQFELIYDRERRGVFSVRPGITGLAQINDVDMSDPERLAEFDARMIREWQIWDYFRIIVATILGKGKGDRVR